MEKKKKIPAMRFPEYVGDWVELKFSDVLSTITRPIKMEDEMDYSLVTVKRRYGGVVSRGVFKGKNVLVKSQFQLKENDFLISKRQIVHNACGLVPKEQEGSIVSNEYSVLIPNPNLDIKYFNYFCQQAKVSQTFLLSSIGVHIEKMLFKIDDWFKWEFKYPSFSEQKKIATFLTILDKQITLLIHKKEKLEQYKKGVMQKIFDQEIRFKDDDGNDYPNWEEKILGDLCKIAKSGGTPSSTNKEYYKGNIPFLSINDMTVQGKYLTFTSNRVSEKGLKSSSAWLVPVDTIIYSMYASVGFVAINKIPMATSQAVLNLILKENICREFIYYSLVDFQKKIAKFITTGTQGNLNAHTVKGFELMLPSLTEQNKIANFLTAIDQKIDQCTKQIHRTDQYKKGLLQQMFV
jgi:type I restriction enzyme S subunit